MSWQYSLRVLFKSASLLGIIPASYCKTEHKLIVTKQCEQYMLRVAIGMMILVEILIIIVCVSALGGLFDFYYGSKTGIALAVLQLLECGVIQLCLSSMFYVFRYKNVQIFDKILAYCETHCKGSTQRLINIQCIRSGLLVIIYIVNVAISSSYSLDSSFVSYICNVLLLSINFIYTSVYISCMTCMLYIVNNLLKSYNEQLKVKVQLNDTVDGIVELLKARNELLCLCSKDVNVVYGLTMLIQSVYILSCISAFLFLTTALFNLHKSDIKTTLVVLVPITLYSMPPLMIYSNVLWVNKIDMEVKQVKRR